MNKVELTDQELKAKAEATKKLKSLRAQYGHVARIDAELFNEEGESELVTAWFKKPNVTTMSAVDSLAKTEPLEAAILGFTECWIEGDSRIKESKYEYVKMDMARSLAPFVNRQISHLKKL